METSPAISVPAGTALVVVAHGSRRPGWNERVIETIEKALKWTGPKGIAFLTFELPQHELKNVVRELEEKQHASQIVIVPLLVSSFSNHYEEIREFVLEHNLKNYEGAAQVQLTSAMDSHPLVTNILAEELQQFLSGAEQQPRNNYSVILVAHGPNEDDNNTVWMEHLNAHTQRLKEQFGFLRVEATTLRDDAPEPVRNLATAHLRSMVEKASADSKVLVLPVLVSVGHMQEVIRKLLDNLEFTFLQGGLVKSPIAAEWVHQQLIEACKVTTHGV